MADERRTWMLELCDGGNDKIRWPMPLELGGKTWDFATNGQAAALVARTTWPEPAVRLVSPERIISQTEHDGPDAFRTDPNALLNWTAGGAERCTWCDGGGWLEETYEACVKCYGTGVPWMQPGLLGGTLVNRRLVYRYVLPMVAHLGAEQLLLRPAKGEEKPLRVRDAQDRWRVYAMPMRPTLVDPDPMPCFEELSPPPCEEGPGLVRRLPVVQLAPSTKWRCILCGKTQDEPVGLWPRRLR